MDVIEVHWDKGVKLDGVQCYLAKDGDDWLIASVTKPKFCFAAPSRVDAIEKAKRGIIFWKLVIGRPIK